MFRCSKNPHSEIMVLTTTGPNAAELGTVAVVVVVGHTKCYRTTLHYIPPRQTFLGQPGIGNNISFKIVKHFYIFRHINPFLNFSYRFPYLIF